MPSRRTTRGVARTELRGDYDVLICGASFAAITVARELAGVRLRNPEGGSPFNRQPVRHRVNVRRPGMRRSDRVARGGRLGGIHRRTFCRSSSFTPPSRHRAIPAPLVKLPTFKLQDPLLAPSGPDRGQSCETATVQGRSNSNEEAGISRSRPTEVNSVPRVVDALAGAGCLDLPATQPPDAPLSRGLEVHPSGSGEDLEISIERSIVPAGYGWSFPANDEVRVGVGSFDTSLPRRGSDSPGS